jgi:hypothetical protein
MFDYPVTLTPDGSTMLVTFADVPEAITFGADEDEALFQAIDALETLACRSTSTTAARCPSPAVRPRDRKPCGRPRWNAPSRGVTRR